MSPNRKGVMPPSAKLTAKDYGVAVGGGEAGLLGFRRRSYASRPVARSAIVIMKTAKFRRLQDGSTASGGTFAVRFIPCGVASKAQEINNARPNPRATITVNAVSNWVRPSNVESKIDTASISSHATTA